MTFLPIVQRELRLRSRRWTTYWLRAGAGLTAATFTILFVSVARLMEELGVRSGGRIGQALFITLAWLAFVFCLMEGARATADSVSEEKREGTLGLLFLTDLRGYDVILGKFIGASLNSFYGILSIFPVLGIALLIGGVAPAQFWRMTLVLVNTLFLTMSAGMLISTLCRRQSRAWAGTAGLVLGVTILPAVVAMLVPRATLLANVPGLAPLANFFTNVNTLAFAEVFGRISPMMGFLEALASGQGRIPTSFWWTLLAGNLAGWLMLILASIWLPRAWQESSRAQEKARGWFGLGAPSPAVIQARTERRSRLLDVDAVMWLATRDVANNRMLWLTVLVAVSGAALITALGHQIAFMVVGYWFMPFKLVFKVWLAVRACRFFVEARTSGALELFLTTPITERDLIRGQLIALKNHFLAPLIGFLVAESVCSLLAMMFAPDATSALFIGGLTLVSQVWQLATFVACLFAIIYTGMWLAIVLKKPNHAFGLTILLLLILPSFAFCVPSLGIYLFFIFFPRYKLETELRRRIAGDFALPRAIFLPPTPRTMPPPMPASS